MLAGQGSICVPDIFSYLDLVFLVDGLRRPVGPAGRRVAEGVEADGVEATQVFAADGIEALRDLPSVVCLEILDVVGSCSLAIAIAIVHLSVSQSNSRLMQEKKGFASQDVHYTILSSSAFSFLSSSALPGTTSSSSSTGIVRVS